MSAENPGNPGRAPSPIDPLLTDSETAHYLDFYGAEQQALATGEDVEAPAGDALAQRAVDDAQKESPYTNSPLDAPASTEDPHDKASNANEGSGPAVADQSSQITTAPKHGYAGKAGYRARIKNLRTSFGNIGRGAQTDFENSRHKGYTAGIGLGVIALQAADRLRASVVFVPTIATEVLQSTHSPVEAAAASFLAFGGWCALVGGATTEGLNQFPSATETFGDEFPGVIELFENSLPGLEQPTDKVGWMRHIGRRAMTGVKRGFTVSGIGSVAYVSTAAAQGRTRKDVHKLNANASLDGGAAVGAIVLGLGEIIESTAQQHPALAERILNDASNVKLWYGVAAVLMASQYISNKLKARKAPD